MTVGFTLSAAHNTGTVFQTLKVGAGGQLRGIDIALDGTAVVKADVGGAYVWDTTLTPNQWRQLVTLSSMPVNTFYGGVWEVAIAPSNSNRIFIVTQGQAYVSNNKGFTFTQAAFPQLSGSNFNAGGATDSNGPNAFSNQKLRIDPANPDVVYFATNNNGIQFSKDGGATASQVAGITASTTGPGGAGIAFDSSSGTVTVSGQTRTKTIYVPSYANGIWQSTDGGVTWSQIANGASGNSPIDVFNAKIDPTGVYYCSDALTGTVFRWQSSTWTKIKTDVTTFYFAIATDPNIAGRVIISDTSTGGNTGIESLDYGATFVGNDTWFANFPSSPSRANVATDIPWLAGSDTSYMTIGDFMIDPSIPTYQYTGTVNNSTTITGLSSTTGLHAGQFVQHVISAGSKVPAGATIVSVNTGASTMVISAATTGGSASVTLTINDANLMFAEGIGVWRANWPQNFVGWNWVSQSIGIEELVADAVIAPLGANPIVAVQDRSFFVLNNYSSSYPSVFYPTNGAFSAGWSLDYASNDPTVIVALSNWSGTDLSSYSLNSGATWTIYSVQPSPQNTGGNIAAATKDNVVWVAADNGFVYYSLNASSGTPTWPSTDLPANSGYINSHYDNTTIVAADRVDIGTFYLHNKVDHHIYKSTNGGQNWTAVYTGSALISTNFLSRIAASPYAAGDIWFGGDFFGGVGGNFYHSTDHGATWTLIANLIHLRDFAFGKSAPGSPYPTIFAIGQVSGTDGIYRSTDYAASWQQISTLNPNNSVDSIKTIGADMNMYGRVYIGFQGTGFAYGNYITG